MVGVSEEIGTISLSRKASLNEFFDPSTPSIRKVDNEGGKKQEKNDVYSGH